MWAAVQAAKKLKKGQRCVVLLPDSVRNYMTKFLDDEWMYEHGFYDRPADDHVGNHEDWCVDCQTPKISSSRPHLTSLVHFNDCFSFSNSPCPLISPSKHNRWTALSVASLPQKFPMTVLPTVTCQDCIQILRREGFDQMPVVDSSG